MTIVVQTPTEAAPEKPADDVAEQVAAQVDGAVQIAAAVVQSAAVIAEAQPSGNEEVIVLTSEARDDIREVKEQIAEIKRMLGELLAMQIDAIVQEEEPEPEPEPAAPVTVEVTQAGEGVIKKEEAPPAAVEAPEQRNTKKSSRFFI